MAPHVWCLVFEGAMPSTLAHDDFRYVSQLATWPHPSPGFADRVTFIDGSMSLLIGNTFVFFQHPTHSVSRVLASSRSAFAYCPHRRGLGGSGSLRNAPRDEVRERLEAERGE